MGCEEPFEGAGWGSVGEADRGADRVNRSPCFSFLLPSVCPIIFSSSMDLAVISIDEYRAASVADAARAREEAQKLAEALILTGAVVVRDSRATKETNDRFLDLLEDYFAQPDEVLRKDERPEVGYQVVSCRVFLRQPTDDGSRE